MINGNTEGIKLSVLEELEQLFSLECGRDEFISWELLREMARISGMLGREVSVFLSRGGQVLDVSVGGRDSVTLPHMRKRRGLLGLSGVRCVHTHPGGSSMLSSVDIGTLLSSRLDAMAAVAVREERPVSLCVGLIGESLTEHVLYGPFRCDRIPGPALMGEIERATQRVAEYIRLHQTEERRERAMLIGLNTTEASMDELALLTDTAGAEVVSRYMQVRPRDKASYIGKGKLHELSLAASAQDIDVAIFNDELTPVEAKNLEEALGLKIVDRTTLILDIFAGRAKTKEGKLQVELAQLKYNLPRLMGEGLALSRLGGGIGTRGPGETKLEADRRRIRRRIFELEREIDKLGEQRKLRRASREKNEVKEVALVGYTNAGKSSLLNALADAGVYEEDKLFATLDPVTRRVTLPSGREVLFTDTVGFIEKLPHELVSAFRSTLEEAAGADLLLNVIDSASDECEKHIAVVHDVLNSLDLGKKPLIEVYNKCDRLAQVPENSERAVFISAKEKTGLTELLEAVERALKPKTVELVFQLGYDQGAMLAKIQKYAENLHISYGDAHMDIKAELPEDAAKMLLHKGQN